MKRLSISKAILSVFAALAFAVVGAKAVSAAQIPWTGENLPSIKTPVFNTYSNVPNGVGNEADFVRLRKSNGDPTVPAVNNDFVDPVNATCAAGEKFDIRTYVHNGADDDYNQNGSGPSVAHNVSVAMKAPLNTTSKKFVFNSTVSATNASSVSDNGTLNCSNDVQLKLVPKTVKVYSKHTGWNGVSDNAVNGSVKIGSRTVGSGDQWGCWDDRVVIVYVVEVVKPTPPAPVIACDALTVEKIGERKYRFGVRYTATNGAALKSVKYYFDKKNDVNNSKTVTVSPFSTDYEYAKAGEYQVTTDLTFVVNGVDKVITDAKCATTISTSVTPCPTNPDLPKDSPECVEVPTPVTYIPATGAASVIAGIFGASATAYGLYAWVESRRALKQ